MSAKAELRSLAYNGASAEETTIVPAKISPPSPTHQEPRLLQQQQRLTFAQSAALTTHITSTTTADPVLYPPSLTKHDNVIADRDLFFDTLNKFHAALGTRLMIPTIGGKELDLHLLYVEVTSRGGHDQVTKDRKWKEVTVVFNFPPTTTSASYVLRKYYVSLLHHYEQVYFFGNQGELVAPSVPVSVPSPGYQTGDNGFSRSGVEEKELILKQRKRKRVTLDPAHLCGVNPGALVGRMVTGVIDGKFDHGYLVTVTAGTEKLKGVLYHMPSGSLTPQFASVPDMTVDAAGLSLGPDGRHQRRRRRRKDEMPRRDPNAPKPNRSGYNFFFQEEHMRLKALYPDIDKEISRMIGEEWNKLTEEKKSVYQERAVLDKERYKREMTDYRERLKACANSGSGIGIVQSVNSGELVTKGKAAGNDKAFGLREVYKMEEEQAKVSKDSLAEQTIGNEQR